MRSTRAQDRLVKLRDWGELKEQRPCRGLWSWDYKETKSEATMACDRYYLYNRRGVTIQESKGVKIVQ